MATPVWQPGTPYLPGAIVVPRTPPEEAGAAITNPGFEAGATDWTLTAGSGSAPHALIANNGYQGGNAYQGTKRVAFGGESGTATVVHDAVAVSPGRSITASCMYGQGAASSGHNGGNVFLRWFDASMAQIGADVLGNRVTTSSGGSWKPTTVTAAAPLNAAFVAVGCHSYRSAGHISSADNFTWNYFSQPIPAGLVYRAVQEAVGISAADEPAWPPTVGVQVVDNEVIWEGVIASRVTWQASPVLESGATEPTWPEAVGAQVIDGSVQWEAVARNVPGVPNSDLVVIAASKVFVGDDDIVQFSDTVNPLARTPDDGGFLPTGLQQYGANPVAAMGLYRSNLVVFNAEAFQMWQVDEDPENMALLDALPVGSTRHHALCAVANELFFASSQGIRSVGIAGASTNLKAGDVGMPIDPLVQAAFAELDAAGLEPIAIYYPAAGQYWLCCNRTGGDCQAFIYTMNRIGAVGAWSRYVFPFHVDDWAIKGDSLYLRGGDNVHRYDDALVGDQLVPGGPQSPFIGMIQWPWLDFGTPGASKRMQGVDVVCQGAPTLSVGYDQTNPAAFTSPYTLPADTLPGMTVPLEVSAPSFSVRLSFTGLEAWHFKAMTVYLGNGESRW